MFEINKDGSIYLTRGDSCVISVTAKEGEEDYTFKAGDVLRIKVFERKACHSVVIQKDFPVVADTLVMDLGLTEAETRIGPLINKPVDYWYEIELNPGNNPQTIVGYDDDGPKIFKMFPEGQDVAPEEPEIDPEDIPVVDEELDMLSSRPVQNQAITKELHRISARVDSNLNAIQENQAADEAHRANTENPHSVTKEQVGLGKVPNVATNDQTPTFTQAEQFETLTSGERQSVSFGKIMRGLTELIAHLKNTSNPHTVTAAQVNLGNVDNTADMEKPVSTAQAQAILEAKTEAVGKADEAKTAADNAQAAADNAQIAADNAMEAANGAKAAADNAQVAADNAQTAADNAHTAATNALQESKAYTDSKHLTFEAVLSTGWDGEIAPYRQVVTLGGILTADRPHIMPVYSEIVETSLLEKEEWAKVSDAEASDGSITFTCFEERPTTAINVQIEVNR